MSMLPDQSAACTHSAILKQLVVVLSDPRRTAFKHVLRLCTATGTVYRRHLARAHNHRASLRFACTIDDVVSGYLNRRRRPIR
jgi:hypothetical protein